MLRTESNGPPIGAVRDAATAALGRPVGAVERRAPGTYALELGDGGAATLRLAPDDCDERRLVEPCLLDALADTAVPTPTLLAVVGPDTSPFGASFCIVRVDGGQRLPDVLALPERAHERLVREAGEQLAALHNTDFDLRTSADGGPYGDLRVPACHPDAPLTVVDATGRTTGPGDEHWSDRVDSLRDRAVAGLRGGEFDDLTGTVADGLTAATVPDRPPAATLHLGYRPAKLSFEPGITWPTHARRESAAVRAVRGWASASTGDGLLDLAIAEDALVGLPLGGTDRARELTAVLREAYVDARGVSTPFGERYAAYLLLARARLLAADNGIDRRTREGDACEAGIRCRERVQWLADELR